MSKTIVITGSTRGIGFALATEFLKKGHRLVVNGTSQQSVDNALAQLTNLGKVVGIAGNITHRNTFEKLIDAAVEQFGGIDIWINNAGIPQPSVPFIEIPNKEIEDLIQVNIYGMMLGTQYALQYFEKQGKGKLFNMEGYGSNGRSMENMVLYGSSKRTVNYFTQAIVKEIKNPNIKIGAINPGMVRTDFLNKGRKHNNVSSKKQFEKAYKYIAEDVDKVTQILAVKILSANKKYNTVKYLSSGKIMLKVLKMMLAK